VSGGSAVVDKRLLGRTPLKELGVAFLSVSSHGGGDILDIRYQEDGQAGETKLFGRIKVKRTVSCRRGLYSRC